MKKYLLTSVMVTALALTIVGTASAEEVTDSSNRLREIKQEFRDSQMDTRQDIIEKRVELRTENREEFETIRDNDSLTPEERREALKTQMENRRGDLSSIRQDRINAFATRVAHRLEVAIVRVETLADRLERRLDILKEKGKDITSASKLVDEARTAISDAKVSLADFQSKVAELSSSENPKDLIAGVREASKNTIEQIRTAHTKVVEAIKSVRGSSDTKDEDSDNDSDPDGDSSEE